MKISSEYTYADKCGGLKVDKRTVAGKCVIERALIMKNYDNFNNEYGVFSSLRIIDRTNFELLLNNNN